MIDHDAVNLSLPPFSLGNADDIVQKSLRYQGLYH